MKVCPICNTPLMEIVTENDKQEGLVILDCKKHGLIDCYLELPAANQVK